MRTIQILFGQELAQRSGQCCRIHQGKVATRSSVRRQGVQRVADANKWQVAVAQRRGERKTEDRSHRQRHGAVHHLVKVSPLVTQLFLDPALNASQLVRLRLAEHAAGRKTQLVGQIADVVSLHHEADGGATILRLGAKALQEHSGTLAVAQWSQQRQRALSQLAQKRRRAHTFWVGEHSVQHRDARKVLLDARRFVDAEAPQRTGHSGGVHHQVVAAHRATRVIQQLGMLSALDEAQVGRCSTKVNTSASAVQRV
mmetsp:Transcript_17955/g.53947  ORF Transcript_17955/g.53947 Transcript_17955/m.53947 type:complete len:256 (-) Transcript_17955:418-1185(-)